MMVAQWMVDRSRLRSLHEKRPDWRLQDFADAIGRSRAWVKKWLKRLRQAPRTNWRGLSPAC